MAQTPPRASAAPPPPKKSKAAGGVMIGIVAAVCAVMMIPTTIIVVVGMIPTAVAYFVDPSRERTLGPVVFCLNFAGIMPALFQLWQQGHNVNNALSILMQPLMMMFVLLPAACGWMLFTYVPYMIVGMIRRKAEARIRALEKYQEDLVEQWGQPVTGSAQKTESTIIVPSSLSA